ncbi:guanylate kinase [Clostridium botulinum B str. Osaka05]|uniref:Guanylate kinase n=1 Tax=Clostridium botulinum B str. Osaka05 TaxID=1407017 RepID=A0A060N345_CLOBO|nr:guanylate kinase [Clostridium botulinum]BAO04846.1 guanylate kinase [Clostridium botulinum B str. Osaka05]
MSKLYCILGKSASGKSTVERMLEKKGLKRIISTTTRPIREGEQEDVDYHYISEDEFKKLESKDCLLENTQYREWHYCIDREFNNFNLSKHDYVCVIEPNGYRQIIKNLGKENVIGVYIYVEDKERLLRSLHREIQPDCQEICRRFLSDIDLFSNIELEVDYCIENKLVYNTVNEIHKIILFNQPVIPEGSEIKIKQINNPKKAHHLIERVGQIGKIYTNHVILNGYRKYKVLFNNNETAYFFGNELEEIK